MPGKAHKNAPTFSQASVGQLFLYLLATIPLQILVSWMTDFNFPVLEWVINPLGSLFNAVLGVFRLVLIFFMIRNSVMINRENASNYHQKKQKQSFEQKPHIPTPPRQKPEPAVEKPKAAPKQAVATGTPRDSIHPWAMTMLEEMQSDLQDIEERRRKLDALMDDFFGNSKISKTRYDSVIDSSIKVLHTNYEKASQAARLFNPTEPLPDSAKQIILNYKADSDQIVGDLNKVIVALLKTHQDEVIGQNDVFDTMLDELVQTTSLYGRTLQTTIVPDPNITRKTEDPGTVHKPAEQSGK